MKTLLTKLFASFNFSSQEVSDNTLFFKTNADNKVEYYLAYLIAKDTLKTYESATSFMAAMDFLKQQNQTQADVAKNTSILLCVLMEDLRTDSLQYKNDILKIEEEEFQYKHYVLPYVTPAVSALDASTDLLSDLNASVNNEDRFHQYFANPYEDAAYFLSMQLFLKLPFLGPFLYQTATFIPIDTMVQQYIENAQVKLFYTLAISDNANTIDWDIVQQDALDLSTDNFDGVMDKLQ